MHFDLHLCSQEQFENWKKDVLLIVTVSSVLHNQNQDVPLVVVALVQWATGGFNIWFWNVLLHVWCALVCFSFHSDKCWYFAKQICVTHAPLTFCLVPCVARGTLFCRFCRKKNTDKASFLQHMLNPKLYICIKTFAVKLNLLQVIRMGLHLAHLLTSHCSVTLKWDHVQGLN